ncbi:MAG: radical SAM family heme chaperone HemW [Bacteroidetes bacterium]|nr:MAG: radical SAM family heme chaperone HemW [Bacteroidota bacterium]
MPGIYIHIPFCRQACHYCNFHFSVSQKRRPEFVKALLKEIVIQKDFLYPDTNNRVPLDTLYFGGGTPSLLETAELEKIFNALHKHFSFSPNAEITLEANPDDLIPEKLESLRELSVNRLSIGIQSFYEDDLRYMNRSHNSRQAIDVLNYAQAAGFVNITADLIYGTPGMSDKQWKQNIMQLVKSGIPHISAYSLTVEKKTALEVFIRKGKAAPVDDDQSARQFEILCKIASQYGYEHYEVSNFGKKGYFSKHNLSYWSGEPYLGLGPSAHSFTPGVRQWNLANTCKYIDSLKLGKISAQKEVLTHEQQYNEYVMTSLRTMWGVDENLVKLRFGDKYYKGMIRSAQKYIDNGKLVLSDGRLKVSQKGMFFADGIAADLFA